MSDFIKKVADKIKSDEGFSAVPYKDTMGHLTIGYGTLIEDIPEDLANVMFKFWFDKAIEELNACFPWVKDAPDGIVESLINMHYNLGINNLKRFKMMLAAMEKGNYEMAADEALDSLWAKQVGKRAHDIARLIRYAKK